MPAFGFPLGLALMFCLVAIGEEPPRVFSAVVEGQVLNLEGTPIPEAVVSAFIAGVRDGPRTPHVRANREGQFSLRINQPGRYTIFASQEREGYVSALFPAYGVPAVPPPEVHVNEGQSRHSVVIRLGPKLGRLTAKVLDADTNRPVEKGQVELQVRSDHRALVRQAPYSEGQFQLSLPPRLFNLRVSAPGYQDWYGNGSKAKPEFFAVELGENRGITVLLRPVVSR